MKAVALPLKSKRSVPVVPSVLAVPDQFRMLRVAPAAKGHVELSVGGHGWVNFSLDGKFAWCHTPDVFDAQTKQKIATLRDENGKLVSSSKLIEVHMQRGKVVRVSSEFGLGRK